MEYVESIRDKRKIERVKNILKQSGSRDYILFLLGINSGLRISDILRLKVSDVMNKKYISIKEQKTNKNRKVPITESFKLPLVKYISGKSPEDWLFSSQRGNKAITRIQAYRIINTACQKAGIKTKIGTHTLRKTFGYHLYQKTKDVALLQNILNHSSPTVTLRYIGINQDIIDSKLKSFWL